MTETTVGRAPAPRTAWVPLAAAWIAFAAALLAWLARTPGLLLREQLKSLQFWSLEACFVLVAVLVPVVVRRLVRDCSAGDAARMALLALAALVLTVLVAPRTNRIYYDEVIYQGVGQNLSDLRLAQMCNDGNVEYGQLQCAKGEYNKQPYAYPHLLSVAYRAFGVHESTAFVVNAIAVALMVCGVYLLVLLAFGDRRAAFFAGLLLALTPQQILWSATAAVEPTAALACVAAVLCASAFSRARDTLSLVATGAATAYAVQFRPESWLVLPIVALFLWPCRDELRRRRLWWVVLLTAALLAVSIGHMIAVRNEGWGTTDERVSLKYLWPNLSVNGRFYIADWRFPVVYALLALLGITSPGRRHERLALAAWFAAFFAVFLFFYAGSYDYGADVRYSLMTYAPLAALGGVGAAWLVAYIERLRPGVPAYAGVAAAIVFVFLWYAPLVRATTEEAWAARADVRFAHAMMPRLRGNAYVLTHNPGMFHLAGVNAGQMSEIVLNPGRLDALARRYTGGVFLHWNFWCNVQDVVQQEFCQRALAVGPFEAVKEYRERDQRLCFYRLPLHAASR